MDFDELEGKGKYIAAIVVLTLLLAGAVAAYMKNGVEVKAANKQTKLIEIEMVKYKKLYNDTFAKTNALEAKINSSQLALDECNAKITDFEDQLNALTLSISGK